MDVKKTMNVSFKYIGATKKELKDFAMLIVIALNCPIAVTDDGDIKVEENDGTLRLLTADEMDRVRAYLNKN
jgi:hypothetical protein